MGSGRAIALLTHSYYEEDPRVRRQADALVAAGWAVTVYSLRRPGASAREIVEGVMVNRLRVQRHQGAGIATYLMEYSAFFARAAVHVLAAHVRKRFDLVQVATLPDWLVFSVASLRLAGVPVVLDLHEAMPEFFGTRFPKAATPFVRRLLLLQERASIAFASQALTVNDALRARLIGLGIDPAHVTVVPNSPSLARFDPDRFVPRPFMSDGTLRLLYAGALTPTYELDVALEGIARFASSRPSIDVAVDLYGRGDSAAALRVLAADLGLAERVTFHGRIPLDDVAAAIATADVGLAPTRRDAFTEMSLSTKIFEYAAMRKPVLAARLPMVERTFPAGSIWMYAPGDPESFATALAAITHHAPERDAAVGAAAARTSELAWDRASEDYVELIGRLGRRSRKR